MNIWKNKDRTTLILFFLLATSPILFGARHPFIQGLYTFLILVSSGTWIVLHFEKIRPALLSSANIPPFILLSFVFLSSLPLPLFLVGILSPVRAEYLADAVRMAQLKDPVTSLSYFAAGTQLYGVYLLALFLYYFTSSLLIQGKDVLKSVLWIITVIGALEAAYGLIQAMVPSLGVLWLPSNVGAEGCARGTIIYRNQFAAFMNMCWPLAISLGIILYKPVIDKIQFRKRMKNKLTLVEKINTVFQKATIPFWASLFMILAVIFSRSRGGIIVMLLTAALLLFFLPVSRRLKALIAGVFVLLIGSYGGMIGFQNVIDRFRVFYEGAQGRIALWIDSLSILKDHLLTGIGMGSYKFLSPIYLHDVSGNILFDFAHNEYVELAIELGLPMMVLLLFWISRGTARLFFRVLLIKKKSKAVSEIEVEDKNIVALGAFCALIGFLLHAFVDFPWRLPVNMIYATTLLALISAALSDLQSSNES